MIRRAEGSGGQDGENEGLVEPEVLLGNEFGLVELTDETWKGSEGPAQVLDRLSKAGGNLTPRVVRVRVVSDRHTIVW